MAIRHTDWPDPKHQGEVNVAKHLCAYSDDCLHLWFSPTLPDLNDIDILLYHDKVGLFVIEVKAVPLTAILRFGFGECHIKDREPDKGPQHQALRAKESLLDVLRPRLSTMIYPTPTACWPKIERQQWNQSWSEPRVIGDYANRMIFSDDLYTDYETFLNRLRHIRRFPPLRSGSDYPHKHDPATLLQLERALTISAARKPTPSDLERLKAIEDRVKREAVKDAPPESRTRLMYRGAPGTGKTFRLLQTAYSHAVAGKRVLFLCFNKVLASDIKRLLSFSKQQLALKGSIEVYDLFELLDHYAPDEETKRQARKYDEWGQLVVTKMADAAGTVDKYDTLLIDEAQDLRSWAFPMIDILSKPDASLLVCVGYGQELYGEAASWLGKFCKAETKTLRRNFRNTEPIFKLSQLFFEAYGKGDAQFQNTLKRFKDKTNGGKQLELLEDLERTGGSSPALKLMSNIDTGDSTSYFFADEQRAFMVKEYRRFIEAEFEALTENQRPLDLLILVPGEECMEHDWAVDALKEIGRPYLDYVVPANRRRIPDEEMIRLCTFHSSKGIEGQRVLVFGFEKLDKLAKAVGAERNNLGYIVLSRASVELTLVQRAGGSCDPMTFVRRSVREIRNGMRVRVQEESRPLPGLPIGEYPVASIHTPLR
jgi:hypothetical protein